MDTATHEIYTDCHSLALHAALPISGRRWADPCRQQPNWTASPCRACGREAQVSIASAESNRATTPPAAALRRPGGVTTTPLGGTQMVSEDSDRNSRPFQTRGLSRPPGGANGLLPTNSAGERVARERVREG